MRITVEKMISYMYCPVYYKNEWTVPVVERKNLLNTQKSRFIYAIHQALDNIYKILYTTNIENKYQLKSKLAETMLSYWEEVWWKHYNPRGKESKKWQPVANRIISEFIKDYTSEENKIVTLNFPYELMLNFQEEDDRILYIEGMHNIAIMENEQLLICASTKISIDDIMRDFRMRVSMLALAKEMKQPVTGVKYYEFKKVDDIVKLSIKIIRLNKYFHLQTLDIIRNLSQSMVSIYPRLETCHTCIKKGVCEF